MELRTMRITVFGAAGQVGKQAVAEGLSPGHEVTAVVRDPARFGELPAAAEAVPATPRRSPTWPS
jgi:uncharacterized protein